jgi:hypothetical protein
MPDEIDVLRQFRDETPSPSTDAWLRARAAIAVASMEETGAVPGGSGPGAGRAAPAGRRSRLGQLWPGQLWLGRARLLTVTAAAAAVAVVAAVLVTSAGGTGAPSAQQIETMAYLTKVEHAVDASQADLVSYARTSYPGGAYVEPVPGGVLVLRNAASGPRVGRRWAIGSAVHLSFPGSFGEFEAFSPTGQKVFGASITGSGAQRVTVAVIYADSTWWRATGALAAGAQPAHPACGTVVDAGSIGWPAYVHGLLQCGSYTLAGRQWVDGVDAVKIVGSAQIGLRELWVDPKTYLPVRTVSANQQTDFRWLKPSAATLARLKLTIPAGFRHVTPPGGTAAP